MMGLPAASLRGRRTTGSGCPSQQGLNEGRIFGLTGMSVHHRALMAAGRRRLDA